MKCIDDCQEYVKIKSAELKGCGFEYRLHDALFSTFNHLSTYFPDAYEHMLKVWGISEENDLNSIKDYMRSEHAI